jgi:hypothetical protein
MKKAFIAAAAAALLFALPAQSQAHEYDRDDSDYWLRYVAYVAHPIGMAMDQWVLRPIHNFVHGSPSREKWMGHDPAGSGTVRWE